MNRESVDLHALNIRDSQSFHLDFKLSRLDLTRVQAQSHTRKRPCKYQSP